MLGTPPPLPWRSSLSLSQRRVDTASVSRSTGRRRASVFPQRPKLHGNTVIKEGGEKFKGLAQPRGLDSDPPEKWGGGGGILCDICSNGKAVKSCLTCLAAADIRKMPEELSRNVAKLDESLKEAKKQKVNGKKGLGHLVPAESSMSFNRKTSRTSSRTSGPRAPRCPPTGPVSAPPSTPSSPSITLLS